MIISYFFTFGTIALIFLTIEEKKFLKFGLGEDKKNYVMLGVAFSLLSHISQSLWFIFLITLFIILIVIASGLLGFSTMATGTLFWVLFGMSICWLGLAITFIILLLSLYIIAWGIKKILKSDKQIPYLLLILASFVIVSFVFGLYF